MGGGCRIGRADQLRNRAARSGTILPKHLSRRCCRPSRGNCNNPAGTATSAATISSSSGRGGCDDTAYPSSAPRADTSGTAKIAGGTSVAM